jgi:hypothetical protein
VLKFVIVIVTAWFVAQLLAGILRNRRQPAEPDPGDYAGVPARLRPRPNMGAGAIALAEPDEEGEGRPF